MGCSITLLLERVDFTGRIRWPVGGLIETRNRGVGLRGGTAYSFPCFLGSLQLLSVLILAGARNVRMWLSATLLALLRDSNDRSVCLCLGRLVIAVSGFLWTGRPAASES